MRSRPLTLLSSFLIMLGINPMIAQDGYKITININGKPDTIAFLGSYYGENMTVDDTAFIKEPGKITFEGNQDLAGGVYFLVDQDKTKLFEFVIDKTQNFELSTDSADFISHMKVKGSQENEIFFNYQQSSSELYAEIQKLLKMKSAITSQDSMDWVNEQIKLVNEKNVSYKLDFMEQHPGHILTLIFNASKEPEIPDSLKGNSTEQRKKAYQYYKNHYWDHIALTDPRILKTPVFHNKVDNYFNQVVPKHPDSIIVEIDRVMQKCTGNDPVYEYLAWYFTANFESAGIMGYDKIFVHMVDNYFRGKKHDWVSETMYTNLLERADRIKPILIGNFAPELVLMDTSSNFRSLYELDRDYVVIFFWTTTCNECKKEMNDLEELFESQKLDLQVFAVNTDTSLSKWKDFVLNRATGWMHVNGTRSISKDYHILYDIYKTPTIFVIDRNKKIIAKHLAAEQIIGFVEKHEKFLADQN